VFIKEETMASVNKVILLGNCGRDPEIRYLPSGQAVANISIATSTRRKDKNTGESVEDTQWHRVTFYDRLAEIAGEYVRKGQPVYIEGRLKYGKYTDQAGVEKNTVDIIATEMQLLGKREGMGGPGGDEGGGSYSGGGNAGGGGGGGYGGGANSGGGGNQAYSRPAPASRPASPPQRQAPAPTQAAARPSSGFDDMDDDIPF
jgi:single-strand DNA-binding protein